MNGINDTVLGIDAEASVSASGLETYVSHAQPKLAVGPTYGILFAVNCIFLVLDRWPFSVRFLLY